MKSLSLRTVLKSALLIALGAALYALAFNWFFLPNGLTLGGFTGASQIVNHLLPAVPIGVLTIVMNVPLFMLGVRRMGVGLLISSLCATAASSLTPISISSASPE